MKNFSKLVLAFLVLLGLTVTACDKRSDVTRDSLSFEGINTEEVLAGEDTKELNKLLGNLTYGQLLDLLGNSLKTLNALADQGYTTKEDAQTLYNLILNVQTYLKEQKAEYDANPAAYNEAHPETPNAMADLLNMAVDANVGLLLNQVIKQAGSSCMTQNIYPMISYAMAAPDDILKGALNGGSKITIGEIKKDDFYTLMDVANGFVDQNGQYKDVHDSIRMLQYLLKTDKTCTVTIDDVKALYDSLDTLSGPYTATNATAEETVPGPYDDNQKKLIWGSDKGALKVLRQTWDNDKNKIKFDILGMTESMNLFLASPDLGMTLAGLNNVLSTDQETLKAYMTKALVGMSSSSGSEAMADLLPYLTKINSSDTQGIAAGLTSALTCNMYGQDKSAAGTKVKISEFRALMYMMQEAHSTNNVLNKLGIIKMMSAPEDDALIKTALGKDEKGKDIFSPTNTYTTNVAEWTIGEVVTAIQYFEKTGKGDALAALNWVLYKKRYQLGITIMNPFKSGEVLISLPLAKYNGDKKPAGQVGMMTDTLMDIFRESSSNSLMPIIKAIYGKDTEGVDGILDPFPAFVELAGGGSADETSWKTEHTPGTRHKLFALFAPLMQSAWENDIKEGTLTRTYGTVDLLAQLNEIGHSEYIALSSDKATFKKDDKGVIFKKLEDSLKPALNSRAGEGTGIVAPVLDLAITVLKKLNETPSPVSTSLNEKSLLEAMIFDLNMKPMDSKAQGEMITKLFVDKDEKGRNLITNAAALLNTKNRTTIASFAGLMGRSLNDSILIDKAVEYSDLLVSDYDRISPILSGLITTTETQSSDANTSKELMDYLTAKIGESKDDNPFISNGKTLAYKILDIQDSKYNPAGFIQGTTPIAGPDGLIVHLIGPPDTILAEIEELFTGKQYLYDMSPVQDLLVKITSSPDIIWPMLNGGDMMTKVLGAEGAGEQYHKISIEPRFVRAMFTAIDNNGDGPKEDAVAYTLMKQINFSYVNKDKEFMQRILKEVAEIMNGSSSSTFRPGTPEFDKLLLTIENLVNHISVK